MQQHSLDIAQHDARLSMADRSQFASETAVLLRRRLTAVAVVMAGVLAAAFVANFFVGNVPLVGIRAIVLAIQVVSACVLKSELELSLRRLRLIELTLFAAIAVQLLLMMSLRIFLFAADGGGASAVAVQYVFIAAWCILLFTYGVFLPNTWKRASAILFPAAVLPYLALLVLRTQFEQVATALDSTEFTAPIPLPFVAAVVAVYGTHVINSVRREAFQARRFGQYHLKDRLGAGGMGEVYRAEHQMLKRPCAIKLIRSESEADAKAIARFEREVCSTAKLSHWNSVEVFDYGRTDDGTFYYVMELLPGMCLEDLVEQHGPLPPARAVHFLRQTCDALSEAHATGLIHRDIKPANIFAALRGGVYDVAKLLDFGLVRQTEVDVSEGQEGAKPGGFSGSPLYMAPEQAVDYNSADERSDIYALGGVAYFLLTGQPPFAGKTPFELILAHARRKPKSPAERSANVPADVAQVVLRCLAKAPADRYQSASELEQALAACACADDWTAEDAAAWWHNTDASIAGA